ncbi:hypothetical protein PPTG_09387 [Phytophthora nicotianae INRA-310]|uniref:Uncharacterized protein n=1 Tax=Phytophthora nicotianae (strain INRA-310) TaxID=761204 RepID=W2QES6_PHYN3|nr:hypothetical protein PPTG_09387 [Phytophthora nicotianae INRA-310]ETN11672.1 hypothetical protein PPTG_09387 [Phytophthora nicotianae INRA-310]
MPCGTAKDGAKAPANAAARKAHAKSSKRHSKGSALKEATKVASEAVDASGDSAASKRRSSRRSRSPSMSPEDRPNPRFACREHSPDSENEDKARSFRSVSGSSVEWHTAVPSEHSVDSLYSLVSDHVDHESKTPERSESPADEAKGSPNAGSDEGGKSLKNFLLAVGLERAQDAKAVVTEAQHSKKRMASRSPLREGRRTRPYSIFDFSDEEEEGAIYEPREITNDFDRQQELTVVRSLLRLQEKHPKAPKKVSWMNYVGTRVQLVHRFAQWRSHEKL